MGKDHHLIILGIDPGLATTGWGVIEKKNNSLLPLAYGTITTETKYSLSERLSQIYSEVNQIIKKYSPNLVAVEELFFCKNTKTAIAVGQARGVILLAINKTKISLKEFTPLEVKQAVTSWGGADKTQVQKMVKTILDLKKIPQPDDAADALAIAITAVNSLT